MLIEALDFIEIRKTAQCLVVDEGVFSSKALDLVVSSMMPLLRVAHNSRSDHLQVHVYKAAQQMLSGLDGGGMVAVLLKSALSFLPLVVFLAGPSGQELD